MLKLLIALCVVISVDGFLKTTSGNALINDRCFNALNNLNHEVSTSTSRLYDSAKTWVPGRGVKREEIELTRKSITNEIMSFYSSRVNETAIATRLAEPEVAAQLDGLHVLSLMFQSARNRKKLKNVISLSDAGR